MCPLPPPNPRKAGWGCRDGKMQSQGEDHCPSWRATHMQKCHQPSRGTTYECAREPHAPALACHIADSSVFWAGRCRSRAPCKRCSPSLKAGPGTPVLFLHPPWESQDTVKDHWTPCPENVLPVPNSWQGIWETHMRVHICRLAPPPGPEHQDL